MSQYLFSTKGIQTAFKKFRIKEKQINLTICLRKTHISIETKTAPMPLFITCAAEIIISTLSFANPPMIGTVLPTAYFNVFKDMLDRTEQLRPDMPVKTDSMETAMPITHLNASINRSRVKAIDDFSFNEETEESAQIPIIIGINIFRMVNPVV